MTRTFFTTEGFEVPAVTADQMREIDRIAIEETGPNLFQMMENAGRNLASLVMALLGKDWYQTDIIVLAGTGGNGGGGICAARHLANRNAKVKLCVTDPGRLQGVPLFQYHIYQNTSGHAVHADDLGKEKNGLIIDALIGYSLRGAPAGASSELIRWANQAKTPILSLDMPSGMDATTGNTPGDFIQARWTMTLALPKTGLSSVRTGDLYLSDIGIPHHVYDRIKVKYASPFGSDFYTLLTVK